jgi:hypothetical protein
MSLIRNIAFKDVHICSDIKDYDLDTFKYVHICSDIKDYDLDTFRYVYLFRKKVCQKLIEKGGLLGVPQNHLKYSQ